MSGRDYPNDVARRFPSTANRSFPIFGNASLIPVDPHFSDVQVLLHADTDFTDSSNTGRLFSAIGGTNIESDQSKFGAGSIRYDPSNDFLTTPDAADLEVGNGDFTAECYVRWNVDPGTTTQVFLSKYNSTSNMRSWFFRYTNNNLTFTYITDGISAGQTHQEAWNPVVDVWYHVAVSRVGTNLYIFVDGVELGSALDVGTDTFFNGTASFNASGLRSSGSNIQYMASAWLDEVRFTVGTGRYTGNFTLSDIPFPDQ